MSRIYSNFTQAFNELRRDVKEMGIEVKTTTMQDKVIIGNSDFETLEIQNTSYTVTNPKFEDLQPVQPWADAEWAERLAGIEGTPVNPGQAYLLREDQFINWKDFLKSDGTFAYTYGERFARADQVHKVIERLKSDANSRQLVVSMWSAEIDAPRIGIDRVPCSIDWTFQFRQGKLNMTYRMRSCDIATHFQNDIYLSMKLLEFVANMAGLPIGHFTHDIASLHCYKKDVEGVF